MQFRKRLLLIYSILSITVQLTSCFIVWFRPKQVNLLLILMCKQKLQNPNQSNRRSAIQWCLLWWVYYLCLSIFMLLSSSIGTLSPYPWSCKGKKDLQHWSQCDLLFDTCVRLPNDKLFYDNSSPAAQNKLTNRNTNSKEIAFIRASKVFFYWLGHRKMSFYYPSSHE